MTKKDQTTTFELATSGSKFPVSYQETKNVAYLVWSLIVIINYQLYDQIYDHKISYKHQTKYDHIF